MIKFLTRDAQMGRTSESWRSGYRITWIMQHEIALFFALTFLLSWTIVGFVAAAPLENSKTSKLIINIAAYAPSISAILLSLIGSSRTRKESASHWVLLFIPVAVLVAGVEFLDHIYWEHPIDLSVILADALLVALAAGVITWLLTNRKDAHLRFTGVTHVWFWGWTLVAIGLWPLLVLAGNAIARRLALPVPPDPTLPDVALPFLVLESFLWAILFSGALNEEPGWRGFALPRLQSRFSPLIASIIIGAFWGLWHVPEHLMGIYPGGPLGAVIRLQDIPRAILFTWLYNRTKGNLLVVILFHAAVNMTGWFMSRSFETVFVLVFIVAIPFVVADKMWRRLPEENLTDERL